MIDSDHRFDRALSEENSFIDYFKLAGSFDFNEGPSFVCMLPIKLPLDS